MVALMLSLGTHVKTTAGDGCTPRLCASSSGHAQVAQALLGGTDLVREKLHSKVVPLISSHREQVCLSSTDSGFGVYSMSLSVYYTY